MTIENYIEKILEYLRTERKLYEDDIKANEKLPRREKIEAGMLIPDGKIVEISGDEYLFEVQENYTKLRPGDMVELSNQDNHAKTMATVVENLSDSILVKASKELDDRAFYSINVRDVVLLNTLIALLEKMNSATTGATFIEQLAGISEPTETPPMLPLDLYDIEIPEHFNEKQKEICDAVLKMPSLYCIQGPPGTGKTQVLAALAHNFSINGYEVLIVAKSHQAVNNALNKIAGTYDYGGQIIKVGEKLKGTDLNHKVCMFQTYSEYIVSRKELHKKSNGCSDVVGMTLQATIVNLGLKNRGFQPQVVLMDEASQIPLTEGCIIGTTGASSIIFIGDDKQMPPIFHEKQLDDPLSVSIFEFLVKKYPDFEGKMNVTYRMNDEITKLVSSKFYEPFGEKLIASEFSAHRRLELDTKDENLQKEPSVTVCNLTTNDMCEDANPEEAEYAATIIQHAIEAGMKPEQIAVITPYRRQVRMIREVVGSKINCELPLIDTVERLQGQDVDVIIISYCTSSEYYYIQNKEFLLNPNRLNVMISRAKRKVIILKSNVVELSL